MCQIHTMLLRQLFDGRRMMFLARGRRFDGTNHDTTHSMNHFRGCGVVDPCQQSSHSDGLAGLHKNFIQDACCRRRDLQIHLFRLNLQQGLVFFNGSPEGNQPFHDRSLRDAFAQLGHDDVSRHNHTPMGILPVPNTRQYAASVRAAATMSAVFGRKYSSSGVLKGTGVSGAAMRRIGPSKLSKHSSAKRAAISAPMPPVLLSSCSTIALLVLCTDEKSASLSS